MIGPIGGSLYPFWHELKEGSRGSSTLAEQEARLCDGCQMVSCSVSPLRDKGRLGLRMGVPIRLSHPRQRGTGPDLQGKGPELLDLSSRGNPS